MERSKEDIVYDLVNKAPSCMRGVEFTEEDAELVMILVNEHNVPYEEALTRIINGVAEVLDIES